MKTMQRPEGQEKNRTRMRRQRALLIAKVSSGCSAGALSLGGESRNEDGPARHGTRLVPLSTKFAQYAISTAIWYMMVC